MSRSNLRFLRNKVIDEITAVRLREYEAKTGDTIRLPVPIENVVEQVLGLDFDWDEIEERPGEEILGGLDAENKKILLNTRHTDLFEQNPGLLRSTIGHEAGHFDIDIDRSKLFHPTLPGIELRSHTAKRHACKSDKTIEVLFQRASSDEVAWQAYKLLTEGQDAPEVKSAVDRYQSALLMPEWLVREASERLDFTKWSDLYRLRDEAEVSISNLVVRLQRLNLIFIPEGTKTLYRSKDEYTGQKTMF
jgi:hypothetical protein